LNKTDEKTVVEPSPKTARGRSVWADAFRRLKRNRLAMVCLVIIAGYFGLAGFIYLAEFAGWQVAPTMWAQNVGPEYSQPSKEYWFGTDFMGRSVLRKTLYGAKVSITVGLWASVISLLIGVPLGAIAGYFRGVVDEVVVWLYTTLSSIPYILLILAFALVLREKSLFGIELRGITSVYLAIGLTGWVGICRLIRGEVIKHREREYVLAAQSYGSGNGRIIFLHVLPNVFHLVIIYFSLRFVTFIQAEVILSFLGLGATNQPSWGVMIDTARLDLPKGHWWEMTAATAGIFFISLALNIFGDALRDALDPKLRVQ
jgi:peptide/nickel transport system permease protein